MNIFSDVSRATVAQELEAMRDGKANAQKQADELKSRLTTVEKQ